MCSDAILSPIAPEGLEQIYPLIDIRRYHISRFTFTPCPHADIVWQEIDVVVSKRSQILQKGVDLAGMAHQ